MKYIKIGEDDLEVSPIGIGTWQGAGEIWGDDVKYQKVKNAIIRANELGVNLIDTAEAYGEGASEKLVGDAISELERGEIVVATKVNSHLRYEDVKKACQNSLDRLGLEQIDIYQVHWPDPWQQTPLEDTMSAMEDLYLDGKIKSIGVSNFAVRDLEEAREALSETDIVSNQVRYNMLERQTEREVLPYCREEGIAVIGYSPLAQGALTGKYTPENLPQDDVRSENSHFRNNIFKKHNMEEISDLLSILEKVAENHNRTPAQVAINWVARKPGVIPIPGAKNPQQAEWNANAVGWDLTDEEAKEIDEALEDIHLDFF